jgi:hypothetical protein
MPLASSSFDASLAYRFYCRGRCRELVTGQPSLWRRAGLGEQDKDSKTSCGRGGAPERSKPRPSNLLRLRSRQSQSSMTVRRFRHIFKPTLLPLKSRKASSRSASRVGITTKPTSSSLHHSPVWFAGEVPPTPTIFDSPSRARWGARSATNSRYLCAEPITATSIASETKSPGGGDGLLIPSPRRGCSGFQPGVSNEAARIYSPSCWAAPSTAEKQLL